ncbi:MAG: PIG-L family deacetylase [Thermodesulfobacteriota bacterium]
MSKCIVVVSPHPDDLEIGMGGTAAKMIDGGYEIVSLLATNGSGSTSLKGHSEDKMAEVRLQEAREAVSALGVQTLIPLQLDDVKSDDNKDHFKNDFKETLTRFKPEEVYIPHPKIDKHPTHKIVSELVVEVMAALDQKPEKIWCYEVWTPFTTYDRLEDISEFVDQKIMAIEAHKSQLDYKNYTDGMLGLNRYRAIFDERHGKTEMKYAEVFIELSI